MLTLPDMARRIARASKTIALLAVCLTVACATAGGDDETTTDLKPAQNFKKEAPQQEVQKEKPRKESKKAPKKDARKSAAPPETLGAAVRMLGEEGTNLVLMKGLEEQKIDRKLVEKLDRDEVAKNLAEAVNAEVQSSESYAFLYPGQPPYDALAGISLAGRLDPAYRDVRCTLAIGTGTKLFSALALLSQGLDKAFVADNALAETPCGEFAIKDAPVESVIEALLKSSRILGFGLDSTDEFVFISGAATPPPRNALLNSDKLNDAQRALLEKRVTVHLPIDPRKPSRIAMEVGAEGLDTAAEALSRQLGVQVAVDPSIKNLPVNPVVMPNVRVGTALDLIIRQWPVRGFGYEVKSDSILIRRRTPNDGAQ
ncbi:MAG: hypothetical protein RBU21_24950 [FCB group bacterium]|jgi:hypothetical protein|nr:hypothetical protein [FCB group bacterium]